MTEGAGTRRAFIVWDSTTVGVELTLEHLTGRGQPVGWSVKTACLDPSQGDIWETNVAPRIEESEVVLALMDLPNANVAYEVGFALGLACRNGTPPSKRVLLAAAAGSLPPWMKNPPFKGQNVSPGDTLDRLTALITGSLSMDIPEPPSPGDETVLLCPADGQGKPVRETIAAVTPSSWRVLETEGWAIRHLPTVLRSVKRIVWTIVSYPGPQQRDGAENAAAAAIAGYGKAHGLDVRVWRQSKARDVVDVGVEARDWTRLSDLEALVYELEAERPEADGGPDVLTRYRRYVQRVHTNLVPFFSHVDKPMGDVYVELALDVGAPFDPAEIDRDDPRGRARAARDLGERAARLPKDATLETLMRFPPTDGVTGRYVVIGEPGAGKSTICRHLCHQLAGGNEIVPVFFSLARLFAERGVDPFALAEQDLAEGDLSRDADATGLAKRLRALAQQGKVWLFADGLDEVPGERMPAVRRALQAWASDDALVNVRLVVTTRAIGYDALDAPFVPARLKPLGADRARTLLGHWLKDKAADAWTRIQAVPTLAELAENPLMLTLVAIVALEEKPLPTTRAKLYAKAVEVLLERGHGVDCEGVKDELAAARVLAPLGLRLHESGADAWVPAELHRVLSKLCAETPQVKEDVSWWGSPKAFLDDVSKQSGILGAYRGAGEPWRYMHRSLREYFAAVALKGDAPDERLRFVPTGKIEGAEAHSKREKDLRLWGEVYALLVGLLDEEAEKVDLLQRLREASAALLLRVLPHVERIAPTALLDVLTATEGWGGDDLWRLVRAWRRDRVEHAVVRDLLWPMIEPGNIEHSAFVLHALERSGSNDTDGVPFDRHAFFEAAGLPPVGKAPTIATVELPLDRSSPAIFRMGSPDNVGYDPEHPRHSVTLSPFAIATTPITEKVYAEFDRRRRPKKRDRPLPVVEVSWWEAWLFCRWLGGDLPTEGQWEYACRGGTQTQWWTGDDEESVDRAAWYDKNSGGSLHPVAQKDANPFGLYDVHGNVWEWCRDGLRVYTKDPQSDPVGPGGAARVVRGGNFRLGALRCRSACRGWTTPATAGSSSASGSCFRPPSSGLEDGGSVLEICLRLNRPRPLRDGV